MLSEKIAEAMLDVQKFERRIRIIESVSKDITEIDSAKAKVVPAIFYSKENLFEFQNDLSHVLAEHERYLDMKTVAFLIAMQRYLSKLMVSFVGQSDEGLQQLGLLLSGDVTKWQKDLDKHVIKKINKNPYKLNSLSGKKWDWIRTRVINKYVDESDLSKIVEGMDKSA